ncbi:MAG: heme lyase CcmF/NrfE family subunit [Solirubrobacteraceae bacterium]
MATVGQACLILSLAVCAFGIGASIYGARAGRRDWVAAGRRSVYALALLSTAAFVVLEVAFLTSDFHYQVVATHSSTTTPFFYRFAAAWSSQEGSLLLWIWLLSMWSSLVLFLVRRRMRDVAPYAQAVLLGFGAFFAGLLVFAASPFGVVAVAPTEGTGLNPLLRHPSMMIHPPMLYSGYTLWAVPFAFAIGALIVRRVDAEWIRATRRFALAAWFFLGVGILLGARWSYSELGWGGYWAWDPVENASLLPWLTGTAFLHSIMVQEKRGMLKVWNASLILITGTLAILGTFLVRSGILDSIHAFGASTLGVPFVTLIGAMIVGSLVLVVTRREALRTEHHLDSLLSRESVFLGNNIVLVGLAFVVFWGTFFPLISEAVTGTKAAVGPPWFDQYTVPLALMLVLLSGIGPVIAWRRATWSNVRRGFLWPVVAAAVVVVGLVSFGVATNGAAVIMFALGAFVLSVVAQEIVRGAGARRAMSGDGSLRAAASLFQRNRRRYGGYTVHVGMSVLFIGVAASTAFQNARDVRMVPGQSAKVGGYVVKYVKPTTREVWRGGRLERIALGADLEVRKGGKRVARLHTERGYYPNPAPFATGSLVRGIFEGEATSEVGMKAGLLRDVWTAVQPDPDNLNKVIDGLAARTQGKPAAEQGRAVAGLLDFYRQGAFPSQFRLITSPLVAWIWLGGLIVFAGGLIALWPAPDGARGRVRGRLAARVAQDLGRA